MLVNRISSLQQQAETQIKRRIGIGNHISERKLIDEFARMGMNESIVSRTVCFNMNLLLIVTSYEQRLSKHMTLYLSISRIP